MVDASNATKLTLAVSMLKELLGDPRMDNVPILVVANKQVPAEQILRCSAVEPRLMRGTQHIRAHCLEDICVTLNFLGIMTGFRVAQTFRGQVLLDNKFRRESNRFSFVNNTSTSTPSHSDSDSLLEEKNLLTCRI